jgi:NADH:ubiquinone oxidoreductase subunit C
MTDAELIEKLKQDLGAKVLEVTNPDRRRIFMRVAPADLFAVVTHLRDAHGFTYLATISGVDKGETFELLYHFADAATNVNVRTEIPRADPHVESVTPAIPGAVLYERELQDMFGIVVDNLPDPRPLVLPDDWPAGDHPLRKDWKFERPAEIIPGGKS